jgi:DNA-binding transcriptional MerR regulator
VSIDSEEPESDGPSDLMRLSELAERLNVTLRALRFYEQRGLLAPLRRGPIRFYDPEQRRRAAEIVRLRKLDFSVTEIRDLLLTTDDADGMAVRRAAIERQISELERRKVELETALRELKAAWDADGP